MTDKERIDYLESLTLPEDKSRWILRESSSGRGFRLSHLLSTSVGFVSVREAIDHGVVSVEDWNFMVMKAFPR